MLPCCAPYPCSFTDEDQTSRRIDKMLKRDKRRLRSEIKVLLLGTGESGKSTFIKQMKIIHGDSLFDNQTCDEYRQIIYQNIIKGMKVLIDARAKFAIPWENEEKHAKIADFLFRADTKNLTLEYFSRYSTIIDALWKDSAIQATFQRRNEYQLSDGLPYLLNNMKRISSEKYTPNNQDILHSRASTKSIYEYQVEIKSVPFVFIDVGGQRNQRRRWVECLDNVTSILFMVSSIEYDQYLVEDWTRNRLIESLSIFEKIVNSHSFVRASFILFLNKTDLLIEKLKSISEKRKVNSKSRRSQFQTEYCQQTIETYFPAFRGNPTDLKTVQNFLLSLFQARIVLAQHRKLYSHFTTAVDTENIKHVFNDVRHKILEENISQVML